MRYFIPLILAFAFSSNSNATQIAALSLEELSKNADAALVLSEKSRTSLVNEKGRWVTDVEFTIEERAFGDVSGGEITVRFLGGKIGDFIAKVPGSGLEVIKPATKYFIFLRKNGERFFPLSLAQGVFSIARNSQSEEIIEPTIKIKLNKEEELPAALLLNNFIDWVKATRLEKE
jgi:hypothetical protein